MNLYTLILFILCFSASGYSLFEGDSVIPVRLEYDISKLQNEKETLREEGLPGRFSTISQEFSVEVMSRGGYSFNCKQPQLKLKFNKKENKGTLLSQIKKVKLFTKGTCLKPEFNEEQDKEIIANYLIYKLYNEMSEYSFNVRLLKIKYVDTSGVYPSYEQYGFFLEPKKTFEKRLKLKYVEPSVLAELGEKIPQMTNQELLSVANGFEFFIGNLDYGSPGYYSHIMHNSGYPGIIYGEKNSKTFMNESGELVPIVYDFDYSRFAYLGPYCTFWFPLFNSPDMYTRCTVDGITNNLLQDLNKFKYKKDIEMNSNLLESSLISWKGKYYELINMLGPEYTTGLENFLIAFNKAI